MLSRLDINPASIPIGAAHSVVSGKYFKTIDVRIDCELQVKGFPQAKYKKFSTAEEANAFVIGAEDCEATATPGSKSGASTSNGSSSSKGKKRSITTVVENEEDYDVVYSDGACKGNGKPGSIAGVGVFWGHDDPRYVANESGLFPASHPPF